MKLTIQTIQEPLAEFALFCVFSGITVCLVRGCWIRWSKRKIEREDDAHFAELTTQSRKLHESLSEALAQSKRQTQEILLTPMERSERLEKLQKIAGSLKEATQRSDLALRLLEEIVAQNERCKAARRESGIK